MALMNKQFLSAAAVSTLLASLLVGAVFIEPAAANFVPIPVEHIYIQPEGTIIPSTAPIKQVEAETYLLTGDISDSEIEIKRDNVVVDGAGYTLQRVNEWTEGGTGVALQGRNHVTIKNLRISGFSYGIRLNGSSNNVISGNTLTANRYGIWIGDQSNSNIVSGNSVTKTWEFGFGHSPKYWNIDYAISIHNSSLNKLRNNQMSDNYRNFWVDAEGSASPADLTNDVDASNTIDGKPIYYWIKEHDRTVPLDAGYLALVNCKNITAENLTLACNGQGVLLAFTKDSAIVGNSLGNNTYGIELRESSNNNLFENSLAYNDCGIATYASGNVFKSNHLTTNGQDANFESGLIDNFDGSNTIEGTPAYCWVNQQGKTVPSDAGFVALVNCDGITIRNLNASGKKQGILLISTKNSVITNSTIAFNEVGIYLKNSPNNQITGNQIVNSSENGIFLSSSNGNEIIQNTLVSNRSYGVYAEDSNNIALMQNRIADNYAGIFLNKSSTNTISQNEVRNNSWCGIDLENCQDNRVIENSIVENAQWGIILKNATNNPIYHNNFINNGWRAFRDGFDIYNPWPCDPNVWDNGTTGNYWSNYQTRYPNATETGTSGVGDTVYFINVNNTDRYPLMKPVVITLLPEPSFPSPTPSPSPSTTLPETQTQQSPKIQETVITAEVAYAATGIAVAIIIGAAVAVFLKKRKQSTSSSLRVSIYK